VGGQKEEFVPAFVQAMRVKNSQAPPSTAGSTGISAAATAVSAESNTKYAKLSVDELKKMLNEMEPRLEKEIEAIKNKYAKQRKDIESALQKKKKK
jgi:hypothetical protein